ncbi:hypothetical protein PAMA_013146 [Pampus argenteus]
MAKCLLHTFIHVFYPFYLQSPVMTVTAETQGHHGPQSKHTLADNGYTIHFVWVSMQTSDSEYKFKKNENKSKKKGEENTCFEVNMEQQNALYEWGKTQLRCEMIREHLSLCLYVFGLSST